MPARKSPEDRQPLKKEIKRVRRRYKVNIDKRKKLLPGEIEGIVDTVIVLRVAGYSNRQIGEAIGISKGQVGEILKNEAVADRIVALRKALPQAAMNLIQSLMVEAVMAIADVMRTDPDGKVVLMAAADILDRGGAPKASRQERNQVIENRTTITDDGIVDALRTLSPEDQERAAAMIEELEKFMGDATKPEIEESNEQIQ